MLSRMIVMSNVGGEKCLENSGDDAKVLCFSHCFGCASLGAAGRYTLADGAVYDVSGHCWLKQASRPPGESGLVSWELITDLNHLSCISFFRCKCWTSFRWKEGRRTPSKESSPFCQVSEWAPAKTVLLARQELFPSLCVSVHML